MLDSIELTHFKCFEHVHVPLGALTLLTGLNGTGKSTVLQAMLLLRQSNNERLLRSDGLLLNGEILSLGTVRDVRNEFADDDNIGIALEHDGQTSRWTFLGNNPEDDLLLLQQGPSPFPEMPLFEQGVHHLSADRVGPRMMYAASRHRVVQRDDMRSDGSLAVAWLHERQGLTVEPALRHDEATSDVLLQQVQAWLGEISPGVGISTNVELRLQVAELTYSYSEQRAQTAKYRPVNVGFGLSYTLPIIVACLAAGPGKLLLIENPEAHLHPRGQMAMGDLMARAAAAGAQVLVETHSDHVLNGVRLAVKRQRLSSRDVALHFFDRRAEGTSMVHDIDSPVIDDHGRLDHWPDGFFDQMDIALEQLL